MAKHIDIIKCPQCGSVENTEPKPDFFKCSSCGTEYFLDDDEINNKYTSPIAPETKALAKRKGVFVVIFSVVILLISIVSALLFNKTVQNTSSSFSSSQYSWEYESNSFFETPNKKPVFIVVGTRSTGVYSTAGNKVYAGFYDATNGKEIAMQEIQMQTNSLDINFRHFENGDIYFILNKARLFKVNKQNKSVAEVLADTYKDLPVLQSGIAIIEFVYEGNGDGFNITTNEGKQLYYYPLIQKTFSKDSFSDAQEGFKNIPANTTVRSAFIFSGKSFSSDYSDEKIQLIKYQYKTPIGFPKNNPSFSWSTDFNSSGSKVLINKWGLERGRVVSYNDFTPNRLYFEPKVLTFDDKTVLIAYKNTPVEDSPFSIQLLDANTAKILWTYSAIDKPYVYTGCKISSGYFIDCNIYDLFLDNKGKKIYQFNPE